jgi:hypothetical protein
MTGAQKTERQSAWSLQEAAELLTVAEVAAIERHYGGAYGVPISDGGIRPTSMSAGVAWALERRADLEAKADKLTSWEDVEGWTLKRLSDYFPDEAVDVDPEAPESAEGKDA